MKRGFRGILLVAAILAVSSPESRPRPVVGSIFGKVTDSSGAVCRRHRHCHRHRPAAAAVHDHRNGRLPVSNRAHRHLHGDLRAVELQESRSPERRHRHRLQRRINQKLEVGAMTEEITVTAASPVVDTKKTTTGAAFTKDILENIPTARDPWQIINMAPGVRPA